MKRNHLLFIPVMFLALFFMACPKPKPPQQDCIAFDPVQADVLQVDGRWKIFVDDTWLLDFEDNENEARQALAIIKHYSMDQQCFVGRPDPSLEYYLVNGGSPSGAFPNEDCISFNPNTIEVKQIDGRWKIVDGGLWLLDFEDNESEARLSLRILKYFEFDHICYVGRPDPSMTYFRQ